MDTYDLIMRNAEEVVTDDEVRDLATDADGKRAYVATSPPACSISAIS